MLKEPIKLTIYGDDNEEFKTCECKFIPWGMLKKALALTSVVGDGKEIGAGTIDAMADFVCDLFNGQVTREELDEGADMVEVIAVIKSVVSYAGALNPNA